MFRFWFRTLATAVSVIGVILLIRAVLLAATGALVPSLLPGADPTLANSLFALALALPVPLHVISIGLIVQKRWLSSPWDRVAWVAIVTSGCWLGAALAVKLLFLGA